MSDWDNYDIDIDPLEFNLRNNLGQDENNKDCCIVLFIFGASITATTWGITVLV